MVRFTIHQNIMSASRIWRPGEVMPVEDEHVALWADYEKAGQIVRLPDDDAPAVAAPADVSDPVAPADDTEPDTEDETGDDDGAATS